MANGRIKRPAYQWYPADADSDEIFKLMTYEQEGVYRRLLDHQWIEGSIPADPTLLALLLPKMLRERFTEIWPLISAKFRLRGSDRLVNDRLEVQRKERDRYVKTQQANIRKRWDKWKIQPQSGNTIVSPSNYSSTSSSSSTSKTVSTEQKQAPDKAPSPAKEFLAWFQIEYKTRRHGATYFVSWEKHMPIVGRLLKLHDPQRLRKHAQYLLTTNEPWTETTDRGIEVLAGKINWLEEKLCAWEAQKRAREAV